MLSVKHWLIFHEGKGSFQTLYLLCILTWFITVTVSELRNILTEKMKLIQLYFRSQNFCEIELSQSKSLSKHNYNLKIPIFTLHTVLIFTCWIPLTKNYQQNFLHCVNFAEWKMTLMLASDQITFYLPLNFSHFWLKVKASTEWFYRIVFKLIF